MPRYLIALLTLCLPAQSALAQAGTSRSFTFVYEAATTDLPSDAEKARLWLPVPMDNADQVISEVHIELTANEQTVTSDPAGIASVVDVGGTAVICTLAEIQHGWGRSLCIETAGKPVAVRLTFDCTRRETKGGQKASPGELQAALRPDSLIPLNGKVTSIAHQLADGGDDLSTGRILYDHTLDRMRYDKPEGGAWGRGDAEWACDNRYGNCTDFHSYFMGLARSKGIPARFEMGFSIPGGNEREASVGGYHCWAFFYADSFGWVPVDISEADKHADKAAYFFGNLDENRVTMTGGRDLILTPSPAAGTVNFLVYPYFEVDGVDCSRANITRAFRRINK